MTIAPFPPHPSISESTSSLGQILKNAIAYHPFNFVALIIFAIAIIHTLFAHQIAHYAHKLENRWDEAHPNQKGQARYSFWIEVLHFLGEVEIVFAIWVIPLLICISIFWDWKQAVTYLNSLNYREPLFVIVIMVLASTRPILKFAEVCLRFIAKFFKERVSAWWLIILTFCPILGSFITEPGAMILAALLLKEQFYKYSPSKKFAYGTLGLLFVHISIGGVLTNFAAPPVLMVAQKWGWTNSYMFFNFGIKSMIAIVISNLAYFFIFRKELKELDTKKPSVGLDKNEEKGVPLWVTFMHILFLVGVVFFEHYSVVLVGILFLFVAFHRATTPFQDHLNLRGPILVGSFLAGLVVHGSLQGWWIEPIITKLSPTPLMLAATVLTSFNDNALITYLSSLIDNLSPLLKYAIVSGAVAGGGLTVIANAPNPAGQFLLKEHFEDGVAPWNLFLSALFPTLIILALSIIWMLYFVTH
ncbi:MAG: hypothetical protein S4CHLAM7_07560 [Chlamydiae bacterium]|nr:hypothetical protein [Chlamydiota bacterium]